MPSSRGRDHVLGQPAQGYSTAELGCRKHVSPLTSAFSSVPAFVTEDASLTHYKLPHIKLHQKGRVHQPLLPSLGTSGTFFYFVVYVN